MKHLAQCLSHSKHYMSSFFTVFITAGPCQILWGRYYHYSLFMCISGGSSHILGETLMSSLNCLGGTLIKVTTLLWPRSKKKHKLLFSDALFIFIFVYLINFWLHYVECRILVPWPEMQPVSPVVEAQIPYHWTDKEVPHFWNLNLKLLKFTDIASWRGWPGSLEDALV